MKLDSVCCENVPLVEVVMPKRQTKMSKTIAIGWSAPMWDNINELQFTLARMDLNQC